MKTVLVSWLGNNDIYDYEKKNAQEATTSTVVDEPGPLERAVLQYDSQLMPQDSQLAEIRILASWGNIERGGTLVTKEEREQIVGEYCRWLQERVAVPIKYTLVQLENVTDFAAIYEATTKELAGLVNQFRDDSLRLVFHTSPGTPAMQAIWLLLAKTEYPGTELIKTSREAGLELVDFPFDIAMKYQSYYSLAAEKGGLRVGGLDREALAEIKWRSPQMQDVLQVTANVSLHDQMHVLIEGESGVGKELFARLIHQSSRRKDCPFITVNCGAITGSLIESELFGHLKGSFTGADRDKIGKFQQADNGILFLDEIGDLPLEQQVKILRLTDTHKQVVVPVGAKGESDHVSVNVRIVAATNRNLLDRVRDGSFRQDLFFRLSVGYILVPPLRERIGDLDLLVDHFVKRLNQQAVEERFRNKQLTKEARLFLRTQHWPGNIRELEHTITKALWLYGEGPVVNEKDVRRAMLTIPAQAEEAGLLNCPLGPELDLDKIITEVQAHYVLRAMREAGSSNMAAVARLLGMKAGTFRTKLNRKSSLLRVLLQDHPEGCKLYEKQ